MRIRKKVEALPRVLKPAEARRYLVGHLGLARPSRSIADVLRALRCIQLDPLDPMGTNADLVGMARVDGLKRGDIYRRLLPGRAFEHFAKERCLLPASAFPYYRDQAVETPWWRHSERMRKVPAAIVDAVLEEVRARGPVAAGDLEDRGTVEPINWDGWKSTSKATSMALDILWTQCRVVVAGRRGKDKLFDVPERALPSVATKPGADFARWAVVERAHAAGLLCRAGGAHWSMLRDVRTSRLPDELVGEEILEEVAIEGSPRRYLAPSGAIDARRAAPDGRMRILGPLDPLLWDRRLVADVFGFDYVWEVYKPAAQRRWGWYVMPLLVGDRLVGRLEGRVDADQDLLVIDTIWREKSANFDEKLLDAALARHAAACGVVGVKRPRRGLK